MTDHTLTILVDMDGVTCNWEALFSELFAEKFPDLPMDSGEERRSFDLFTGKSPEVVAAVLEIMDTPDFYARLQPLPGAIQALHDMDDAGINVVFVTTPWARNVLSFGHKFAWLETHVGEGWGKRIVLTFDKTLIDGAYLFDDKPNIKGKHTPTWVHCLVSQPYNRHVTGITRVAALANWREVVAL